MFFLTSQIWGFDVFVALLHIIVNWIPLKREDLTFACEIKTAIFHCFMAFCG